MKDMHSCIYRIHYLTARKTRLPDFCKHRLMDLHLQNTMGGYIFVNAYVAYI